MILSTGRKSAEDSYINHVASALGNRPRDGNLFRFIRSRGCGAFRIQRVVFSFVRSFFSSRTQQKKRAFMFGILLKHFRRLDTCALSLCVNSLSLS